MGLERKRSWSRILFHGVLRLYPRRLRTMAAEEMAEEFEEDVERASRTGWLALARLVLVHLPMDIVRAHRLVDGPPARRGSLASAMDGRRQDVLMALRSLWRNPGFGILTAGTLALGVGAVTSVYAVVDTVWLEELPFPQADRLVALWSVDRATGVRDQFSIPEYMDYADRAATLGAVGAYDVSRETHTGEGRPPRRLRAASLSHSLVGLLGIEPSLGRVFRLEEDVRGGPRVVLVSDAFWRNELGADSILGDVLLLGGRTHRVIGVLPPGFAFPDDDIDVWRPLREDREAFSRRGRYVSMVARMSDGADLSTVRSELRRIAGELESDMPEYNSGMTATAEPLRTTLVGEAGPVLLLLAGGVVSLLILASANVSNLLLARTLRRQGEISVRAAIGAGRDRLLTQLLTENLVLFALGGALGGALAAGAVELIQRAEWLTAFRISNLAFDVRVFASSLGVAGVAGLTFGLLPAWRAVQRDPGLGLTSRRGPGRAGRLSDSLVVGQTALATLLLIGSALLTRTVVELEGTDPGFAYGNLVKVDISLPSVKYPVSMRTFPEWTEVHDFYDRLDRRLRAVPGLAGFAIGSSHPMESRFGRMRFSLESGVEDGGEEQANIRTVSPDYLDVVGIGVVGGRSLERTDRLGSAPVALVNQAFQAAFLGPGSPLGRMVTILGREAEIVGVVEDIRTDGIQVPPTPTIYRPISQSPRELVSILVRTEAADPRGVFPELREAIWDVEPDLPLDGLETLAAVRSRQLQGPRLRAAAVTLFALIAGLLAAVGTSAVLAFSVERQRREIGVRMSLGASRSLVVRSVLLRAALLAGAGALLGLVPALLAARLAERFLYGVPASDLPSFLVGPFLLLAIALLAAMIPAIRAARIPPADVLG